MNVIQGAVVLLSVWYNEWRYTKCRFDECHNA